MSDPNGVVVIGGGLLGLASAWALNEQGYTVSVLDARDELAAATSYANAGMLTPSMADPWNSPGIWRSLLRYVGREQGPIVLRPRALPAYFSWGLRFLRHSAAAHHRRATRANLSLAMHSLHQFQRLREQVRFSYDLRTAGTLQLFRDQQSLDQASVHAAHLSAHGLRADVISRDEVLRREPSLRASSVPLLGAIHYPDDETGDARRYCLALAELLRARGVRFELGVEVRRLRVENNRVAALHTSAGEMDAHQVVFCSAAATPALVAPLGIHLPIKPVKGYSLTLPVERPEALPARSLIDHHLHGAITPLDDRVRLAGTAELAGFDPHLRASRLNQLWQLMCELLPQLADQLDRDAAREWCGFRPMSADGVPYIGATPVHGVYINSGHGHLGWTQSMGSGQLLADLLSGKTPAIDPAPYRVGRP